MKFHLVLKWNSHKWKIWDKLLPKQRKELEDRWEKRNNNILTAGENDETSK